MKKIISALLLIVSMMRLEILRIRRVARLPCNNDDDCRLHHIGVYIILNSTAAEPFLGLAIIEQFLVPELEKFPNGQVIREAALRKMKATQRTLKEENVLKYEEWHKEYSKFRKAISLFVSGVENYHTNKNYPYALSIFISCCELNQELLKLPGGKRGLDSKLLEHYRRQCAWKLNEEVASQFETLEQKNALDALYTAYEYILPCMEFLTSPTASDTDIRVAELIRNRWCSMLGDELPSPKSERLQDFLVKLIEPSNDMPKSRTFPTYVRLPNLEEKYKQALKLAERHGEIAASLLVK